mmetsp:Transcript_7276/g.15896  ORF Transcript_7276/g.15896 Transcript_7276/m.15896 type:complete len:515 (+) Transcript_7276:55-1599(+)
MASPCMRLLALYICLGMSPVAGIGYSQNAICLKNNCINPLYPGMVDLARLEVLNWQCASRSKVTEHVKFCQDVIDYDSALPSPNASADLSRLIKAQDDAAVTMFYYHLSSLGYEAWEHTKPSRSGDPCVRETFKMVCYTYFPKQEFGCEVGQPSKYQRPCRNQCTSYKAACQVECCDDSTRCVFEETVQLVDQSFIQQTGYSNVDAPSPLCTGSGSESGSLRQSPMMLILGLLGLQFAASGMGSEPKPSARTRRASASPGLGMEKAAVSGVLVLLMFSLHGCDLEVPRHTLANWRQEEDFLTKSAVSLPGSQDAKLNSCSLSAMPGTMQCSGNGYCKAWDEDNLESLNFCICHRDYAGPECQVQRKSQTMTFLLSLFGGILGLDYFYLGLYIRGTAKLLTLGGCGIWWLWDIIRVGSAPTYSANYRVAHDLPHWIFVMVTFSLFSIVGLLCGLESYFIFRRRKRQDVMMLHESEEGCQFEPEEANPNRSFELNKGFRGYGAALRYPGASYPAPL